MKNEYLFRALGDVGDDLIHKAETQRFRNPWKNWVSMAAAVAVVISLGALALPYFPSGCSASKSAATESAAEVPKYTFTADMMDQEKPEIIEEESLTEAVPENEMALTAPSPGASEDGMMNSAMESAAQTDVIQITVCSTIYYLRPGIVEEGATPGNIGQYIGDVEDSDNEVYLGCPVYEMAYTVWYSNHAVDGQSVPAEILVEGPDGWIAGFTGNEKTVARYTVTDVQAAMDAGDYDWIMQTFVQPVESQQVRLLDGRSEDSEMLNRLFLASLQLNTGVSVDLAWRQDDGSLLVHPRDVEQRLVKFLDGFVAYDPIATAAYDPELGMLRFSLEEQSCYAENLDLISAELMDDLLYVRVGVPKMNDLHEEVHYMIRFDTDSWRYLSIETPG